MISLVEQESDQQLLLRLCKKTAYGCKIAALVQAYGFEKALPAFGLIQSRKPCSVRRTAI